MAYCYAMGGMQLYQNSMDAGENWVFTNVMGNPVYNWTYQQVDEGTQTPLLQRTHTMYDALQRPTHLWVHSEGSEILAERLIYGENIQSQNQRGQLILHFDGAGLVRNHAFDFKGNLLHSDRLLAEVDYPQLQGSDPQWQSIIPDWQKYVTLNTSEITSLFNDKTLENLEQEAFSTTTQYDALNRPTEIKTPDGSITYYRYNKAGLLDSISTKLLTTGGSDAEKKIVTDIAYNAKGQRKYIKYGNGVKTNYDYDEKTFRLKSLYSSRKNGTEVLQHLHYYYDPVSNITEIFDEAQPTIFKNGERVEPRHRFAYDALYQLICATGRESCWITSNYPGYEEIPLLDNIPVADTEVRNYRQIYRYDPTGNIQRMQHVARTGSWTRTYTYAFDSNWLDHTIRGYNATNQENYFHDQRGNMTLPHLPVMTWDYKDQFVHADKNGNGELFFTYDSGRQRVRKLFFHSG
ncbi:MAG: RHS repeat protein, partial [Bacteroidetes bacterium]|nr:RHS repeat protein [Bacteroidota bacterium]